MSITTPWLPGKVPIAAKLAFVHGQLERHIDQHLMVSGAQRFFFRLETALALAGVFEPEWLMRRCVVSAWHIYTRALSTGIVYKYMSSLQNDGDKKPAPPDISTVVLLLGTIGDTTWRMFVPTIGLTVLGLLIDKQLHTTPWLMVTGIVLGTYLAYVLVRRQIKKVKQDDK